MSGGEKRSEGKKAPEFPALREFFSGYLHEDFHDEYGSALGALKAFQKEASEAEIAAVRKEWADWQGGLSSSSPQEIANSIRQLGGVWRPRDASELKQLGKELN